MSKGILLFKTVTDKGWQYDAYANIEKNDESTGLTDEEYYAQEYCKRKEKMGGLCYNQRKNCIVKFSFKEDSKKDSHDFYNDFWENWKNIDTQERKIILTDNDFLKMVYEEYNTKETYGIFEFIDYMNFERGFIDKIKDEIVKYINIPDTNEKVIPDRLCLFLSVVKDKIEEANRLNRIEKIQEELYFLNEFVRAKNKIKVASKKNNSIYKLIDLGFNLWEKGNIRRMYYNAGTKVKYYIDLNTNTLYWEGRTNDEEIQYIYDLAKGCIDDLKKDE